MFVNNLMAHLLDSPDDDKLDLLLITIATDPTDGYVRFMRSAEKYGYNVRVIIFLLCNKIWRIDIYSIPRLLEWVWNGKVATWHIILVEDTRSTC